MIKANETDLVADAKALKAKATITERRPVPTSTNPALRQIANLRNELVRTSPARFAHRWLSESFAHLDHSIEQLQDTSLCLVIDLFPGEDPLSALSELVGKDYDMDGSLAAGVNEPAIIRTSNATLRVCVRRLDANEIAQPITDSMDIHVVVSEAPNHLSSDSNLPSSLTYIFELREGRGGLRLDRNEATALFASVKEEKKKWGDAVSALKAMRVLGLAERIVSATHPVANFSHEEPPEVSENEDGFGVRSALLDADAEEYFGDIQSRLDSLMNSSSASVGGFYLAIAAEVDRLITMQSLEQQPQKSVSSVLGLATLTKYLFKEKAKLRVKISVINSITKSVQDVVQKEIRAEQRYSEKKLSAVRKSALHYNIESALMGLPRGSDLRPPTDDLVGVKRHLSSAMKSVAAAFEVDYEFKGLFGRLIQARMAMLSMMMMMFLLGRSLDWDLSDLGPYMLGGIALFALGSAALSPIAQKIERELAITRLRKDVGDRLTVAAERAYIESIRDLKALAESHALLIQRNLKALDGLLKTNTSDRSRLQATTVIARARSDSIAATGQKHRLVIEKLRGDLAIMFSGAVS